MAIGQRCRAYGGARGACEPPQRRVDSELVLRRPLVAGRGPADRIGGVGSGGPEGATRRWRGCLAPPTRPGWPATRGRCSSTSPPTGDALPTRSAPAPASCCHGRVRPVPTTAGRSPAASGSAATAAHSAQVSGSPSPTASPATRTWSPSSTSPRTVGAPQSRSSPARIRRSTCGTTLLSELVVQPLSPQDCSRRHRRRSRLEHRPAGRDPRPSCPSSRRRGPARSTSAGASSAQTLRTP
ncbi:MAG: hypothetical protein JWQ37_2692 [Blastococcus sp.]|nr:hypothetical protein [Blastococcus sp.]